MELSRMQEGRRCSIATLDLCEKMGCQSKISTWNQFSDVLYVVDGEGMIQRVACGTPRVERLPRIADVRFTFRGVPFPRELQW